MNLTYDPILEANELRRFRVFAPLSSPRVGTALVLEPNTGKLLTIEAGEQVPEARLGYYRRYFLIDLNLHGLRIEEQLPSADPAFLFRSAVNFSCRVEDPVDVALRGIHDMTAAVRPSLVRIMRRVARMHDIPQFNKAEATLNEELDKFRGNSTVKLDDYLVELSVGGEDAARSSADYHDASRYTRMEKLRRDTMSDVVAGGRDKLVAQWLAKHDGDPSELLQMEAEVKALESEHLLAAMGILASSGKDAEEFDTLQERRRLLGRFLSDHGAAPGLERDRPVRRKLRVAGSLAQGTAPEDVTKGAESMEIDGESNGHDRVSRVRARAASADEPPKRKINDKPVEEACEVTEAEGGDDLRSTRTNRVRGLCSDDRSSRMRSKPRDPDAASDV